MNLRERVWIGLSLLSAAGILLHLGGSAWSWSPPLWQLVVFLIILLVIGWGGREADDGHGARRWQKWLSALRESPFGAALLLVAAVGTAVRMLSLDSGLGQTPINIDETRLAESVLEFFRTGEVPHETVEHYPGILYWLLVGSSLFAYLGTLLTGTARGLGDIPLETFVLAGRMTSTLLAAGITIFTGLIGRALRGSATGLLAAAVVALVPLSVNISSLLRNDAAQLLFITAAVWAAIELAHTPDILAEAPKGIVRVGFAAESGDLLANARAKLEGKRLDLIAANDITQEGAGFGSDTNRVTLLDAASAEERPVLPKYDVAMRILDQGAGLLAPRSMPTRT